MEQQFLHAVEQCRPELVRHMSPTLDDYVSYFRHIACLINSNEVDVLRNTECTSESRAGKLLDIIRMKDNFWTHLLSALEEKRHEHLKRMLELCCAQRSSRRLPRMGQSECGEEHVIRHVKYLLEDDDEHTVFNVLVHSIQDVHNEVDEILEQILSNYDRVHFKKLCIKFATTTEPEEASRNDCATLRRNQFRKSTSDAHTPINSSTIGLVSLEIEAGVIAPMSAHWLIIQSILMNVKVSELHLLRCKFSFDLIMCRFWLGIHLKRLVLKALDKLTLQEICKLVTSCGVMENVCFKGCTELRNVTVLEGVLDALGQADVERITFVATGFRQPDAATVRKLLGRARRESGAAFVIKNEVHLADMDADVEASDFLYDRPAILTQFD